MAPRARLLKGGRIRGTLLVGGRARGGLLNGGRIRGAAPLVRTVANAWAYSSLASAADTLVRGGDLLIRNSEAHVVTRDAETVKVRPGTRIVGIGDGCRVRGDKYALFTVQQASDVVFENVSLDLAAPTNFRKWLVADDVRGLTFRNVIWRDTGGVATSKWTNIGTILQGCSNVLIEDCRMYGVQLKLGGPRGCTDITVRRCKSYGAVQYAYSVLVRAPGETLARVLFDHVEVYDPPGNGGFYIGEDEAIANPGCAVRDIALVDCLVAGRWTDAENTCGFHGRLAAENSNWLVSRLRVLPTNRAANSTGIAILERIGGGVSRGIAVEDSEVQNTDSWGISFQGSGTDIGVRRNRLTCTRGIAFFGAVPRLDAQALGNTVLQSRYGIYADATRGPLTLLHSLNRCGVVLQVLGAPVCTDGGGNVYGT